MTKTRRPMVAKQKKTHRIYNMCSRPLLMAGRPSTVPRCCRSCGGPPGSTRDCSGRGTPGEGSLDVREGFVFDQAYIRETWGNANPLIVEIGSGQGENVVAAAASQPDVNFLALEVYDPGVAHTLLLAGKQNLKNLRIAQINAPELFKAAVDGSIAEVWTFFPDPWPKMRHHKRRIVQPELAADIHRALTDEGVWRIATDIEDYALHVHEVMDGLDGFHNDGALTVSLPVEHVGKGNADEAAALRHADFAESERFDGRVLTNFEKKGLAAGRVIHDFTYRRV